MASGIYCLLLTICIWSVTAAQESVKTKVEELLFTMLKTSLEPARVENVSFPNKNKHSQIKLHYGRSSYPGK